MQRDLPTGEVVFFFTDIEGSTRIAEELGAAFADANNAHRRVVRAAVAAGSGIEVSTHGDAFFVVFRDAAAAATAASAVHAGLADGPLQVRIGLHAGTAELVDGTYLGSEVNRAARIGDAGHGRQTVVSERVRTLLGTPLLDLGAHRLKGFVEPVALYQLGAGSFPALRTVRQSTIPVPPDAFVGRSDQLDRLKATVAGGTARLHTVVGAGGTGKTRFVLEAARILDPHFAGGVHWVPLAPLESVEEVPAAVTGALGVESLDDLPRRIGDTPTLVLLDNAEHLLPELAPLVSGVLAACPALTIVATSRERLRVDGEQLFPLGALEPGAAADLFYARARQLNPLFEEEAAAVEALCQKLDCLPLAVELAAARTTLLNVRQLSDRLAERLDVLKSSAGEERQRTLRNAVAWSYGLLPPDEQRLFARLSIFAGGCTLDSAEAVADADPDLAQSLVEKSLLEIDHHRAESRLEMLSTIRSFAAERLAESPAERDAVTEWYVAFFLEEAEAKDAVVRWGETQLGAMRWFAEELPNLRHAFELAVERGLAHEAARLAYATGWAMAVIDRRDAAARRLRALSLPFDDPALRVRLLCSAAASAIGSADNGTALAEQAVAAADATGDAFLIAMALEVKAYIAPYEEGRLLMRQVIDTMAALGERDHETRAAINLGALALAAGALPDAAVESERALALVRETGNRDGITTTGLNLAQALLGLEQDERAQELVDEMRPLALELGDPYSGAICDLMQAVLSGRSGDHARAVQAQASAEAALDELAVPLEPAEAALREAARAAAHR